MTTFSVVILPSQKKVNGMQPIKIRVAHNNQTRYINTGIEVERNQFSNGHVVKRADKNLLNTKLNGIYQKYFNRFMEMEFVDDLSCAELVERITNGTDAQRLTMTDVVKMYLEEKELSHSTIKHYEYFLRDFNAVAGEDYRVSLITRSIVLKYQQAVSSRCNQTTTRIFFHKFKAIMNYSTNILGVKLSTNPFVGIDLPQALKRDTALTVNEMRIIRDIKLKRHISFVRDMFMLSYYLGGMNLKDIENYRFTNDKQLNYIRAKTARKNNGEQVCFTIQPEAMEIIKRYITQDGHLYFPNAKYNNINASIYVRKLAKLAGIKHRVTFYSARKSFAQHAYDLGVPLSTIEYCMGQKMKEDRPIFAYVKVMKKHADNCIRLVLDNLKN